MEPSCVDRCKLQNTLPSPPRISRERKYVFSSGITDGQAPFSQLGNTKEALRNAYLTKRETDVAKSNSWSWCNNFWWRMMVSTRGSEFTIPCSHVVLAFWLSWSFRKSGFLVTTDLRNSWRRVRLIGSSICRCRSL